MRKPTETYRQKLARQRALEDEARALGASRYQSSRPRPWRSEPSSNNSEADLPPGRQLLKLTVSTLAEAIEEFVSRVGSGGAGRRLDAFAILSNIGAEEAAYLTARVVLDCSARKMRATATASAVANALIDHIEMTELRQVRRDAFDGLVKANRKSRSHSAKKRRAIRKTMAEHGAHTEYDLKTRLKTGFHLINLLCDSTGLFVIDEDKQHGKWVRTTEAARHWLEDQHARCELLEPIHLPMIIPPRPWSSPFKGGYPIPVGGPHPQGDDIAKSLLEFADGYCIGDLGAGALAVHIAGLFGVDKVSTEERMEWFWANETLILDSAINPLDGQRFWATADSPFMALAACMEWEGYCRDGANHITRVPISLDGSNSGLQHFSAMLRDEVGGRSVNLLPGDHPEDVYADVARTVQAFVDQSDDPKAQVWKGGKVTRRICKRPCMTFTYSATRFGMTDMIYQTLWELDDEGSKYLNGDNYEAALWLSYILYDAISKVVCSASQAMNWLKEASQIMSKAGIPIRWTTPVGLPVLQHSPKTKTGKIDIYHRGTRMQVNVRDVRPGIDSKRQANSIAPNFIHSMDGSHLMAVANECATVGIIDLAVVHDSFAVHAPFIYKLRSILRDTFADQYTADRLAILREELAAQLPADKAALLTTPEAIMDELVRISDLGEDLLNRFRDAVAGVDLNAAEIIQQALQLSNFENNIGVVNSTIAGVGTRTAALENQVDSIQGVVDGLLGVGDGQGIATVIAEERTQRIDGDNAIVQTVDLIGAKNGSNTGFIVNQNTLRLSPTETIGQRFNAINAAAGDSLSRIIAEETARATAVAAEAGRINTLITRVGAAESSIASEATARTTADTAFAQTLGLLGSKTANGTAFVLDQAKTMVSPTETLGQKFTAILSQAANGTQAQVAAETTARTTAIAAEASARQALATQVAANLSSAISNEQSARTTAISAETLVRQQLATQVGTNTAAIQNEASARSTADQTFAQQFSLLGATTAGGSAWNLNMNTVQIGGGMSMAIEADPSLCQPTASQLGGAPTDPQRFDDRALRVSEMDATTGSWTLHYMLDTQLSDAQRYPLKTRDLIVMDIDPKRAPVALSYGSSDEQELDFVSPGFTGDRFYGPIQKSISEHWADYTGSVMHVDPSGSGSDETAYVVTKYLEGRIYVRAWGGFRDGTSEATLNALAELAKTEEVREVVIEDNFGDGLYRNYLQPFLHRRFSTRWRCGLSGFKVTKQKELRIIGALEPTLKQHRLVMSKDVIQNQLGQGDYNGLYQMCRMTSARGAVKHDDRIDVLAQAVDHWKAFMNADILKSEANAQAKAAREFEKKFFANTPLARMFDNRPKRGQGRRVR